MYLRQLCFIILFFSITVSALAQQDTARTSFLDTLSLGEVIISAKTAVRIHGDTVSYRVDSFITDPLANTEDVLKRLPGVEVSRDGKITIEGKPVNKLFINGKEYFADDLANVIRNLPAEVIEKIQIADWRDEDAQFTGMKDNTTEKVVNLQMKKKYSGGVYGRAGAGYGTKDRYQAGLFANYMDGGALRLTAIGNANNNGVSDVSNDEGSANNTSWRNPGVRTEQRGNINFSYEKSKKWQLNGSYRFSNNDNYMERSSFRTTYLPQEENGTGRDSLLLQEQNSTQNSATQQHSVSLRSKYQFGEKLSLRTVVSGRLSNQENERNARDITYEDSTRDINFLRETAVISERQSNSMSVANSLMKSFAKKGRTLLLSLNLGYNDNNAETDNDNLNRYFAPPSTNDVRNHSIDNNGNFTSNATINYTEPLNEYNNVSLAYSNSYAKSVNDRAVEVANNNGTYLPDTIQSRGYENTNINNKISLNYWYNREQLTAGLGFEAEPYSRKSLQTSGVGNDVEQTGVNYFPRLFTRYNISKSEQLSFNYSGGITPPSINQLQPIPDYTDSLNIFTGNPQLRPEVSNNINLRYNNNNTKSGSNTWVSLQANWVNRKIINKTELTGSRRTTTPVNADGNYNLGASLNRMEPLIGKKLRTTLSVTSNLANNVSIVNGQLQEISNYTLAPGLRMAWFNDKWYEGSLDYSYRLNRVEGATQSNNTLQSHDITHDGTFIMPAGFRLSYYLSYISNIGLAQNFQQEFFLMNAMLSKTFKKPNGLSLRIQAFDVFNNYPTVQRNIADNYYEDVAVNRIGSYFMFSVVYKFTSFPEKKDEEVED